jgi:hypothetical protein
MFGEVTDLAIRAAMLDEGLELLRARWSGSTVHHTGEHYHVGSVRFEPTSLQQPLPVWVAAIWPHPRPLRRAKRWQGVFPLGLPGPDALAEIVGTVGQGKDIAVLGDRHPVKEWAAAGAGWWLHRVAPDQPVSELEARRRRAAEGLGQFQRTLWLTPSRQRAAAIGE